MQTKEAIRVREAWGNAPCNHPKFVKEYDLRPLQGKAVKNIRLNNWQSIV